MCVGMSAQALPTMQFDFRLKWTMSALNYLGTSIPSDHSRVYNLDFPPLLTKPESYWIHGIEAYTHALIGATYSKCAYYQNPSTCFKPYRLGYLPLYFKQVQALFTRFVWAHKRSCNPPYPVNHAQTLRGSGVARRQEILPGSTLMQGH